MRGDIRPTHPVPTRTQNPSPAPSSSVLRLRHWPGATLALLLALGLAECQEGSSGPSLVGWWASGIFQGQGGGEGWSQTASLS